MLRPGASLSLVEMGRSGREFVKQFEERQVLARFEEELRQLAAEVAGEEPESTESWVGR
jgi:hypothetical protein